MNPKNTRKAKINDSKFKIYLYTGMFIYEFENMFGILYETLVGLLDEQALTLDTDYIESLLCELDTMPLVTKFQNIYGIKYKNNRRNMELIRKISLRIKSIVEFRNALVHTSWEFYIDQSFMTSLRQVFGNTRILDYSMTSIKTKKRMNQHSKYITSISLSMIQEYVQQLVNMKLILIKIQKYHKNENNIIIPKMRIILLDKKIQAIKAENITDLMRNITKR